MPRANLRTTPSTLLTRWGESPFANRVRVRRTGVLLIVAGLVGCRPSASEGGPSGDKGDGVAQPPSVRVAPDASSTAPRVFEANAKKPRRSAETTLLVAATRDDNTFYQAEMKSASEWRLLAFRGAEQKGKVIASQFDAVTSVAGHGHRVCWSSGREVTCKEADAPPRLLASTQDTHAPHRIPQSASARHVTVDDTSVYFVESRAKNANQPHPMISDALIQVELGEPRSHVLFEGELLDVPPVRALRGVVFTTRTAPHDECRLARFSFDTGHVETLASLPNGKPVGLFADGSSWWVGIEDGLTGGEDLVVRVPLVGGKAERVTQLVDWTPGWGVLDGMVVLSASESLVATIARDGAVARTADVGPFDRLVVTKGGWLYHRVGEDVWRKPKSGG